MGKLSSQTINNKYGKSSLKKVILPVPLKQLPLEIGHWQGNDIELSAAVQKIAGNDDYVNRSYINEKENKWVGFYVAYAGQPRNMLGHRPQICYVGAGWIHENTQEMIFTAKSGKEIPCLLHSFKKPLPDSSRVNVLNFYVLNGEPTNQESEFNSLSFRLPNIDGKIANYVAQIQISSNVESNIFDFASLITDEVLLYLPDENGKILIKPGINEVGN